MAYKEPDSHRENFRTIPLVRLGAQMKRVLRPSQIIPPEHRGAFLEALREFLDSCPDEVQRLKRKQRSSGGRSSIRRYTPARSPRVAEKDSSAQDPESKAM